MVKQQEIESIKNSKILIIAAADLVFVFFVYNKENEINKFPY